MCVLVLQFPPLPPTARFRSVEAQVMRGLITNGLLLRVDRVMQKPPPGHKRLPKWPKRVLLTRDQTFVEKIPREGGIQCHISVLTDLAESKSKFLLC